MCVIPPGTSPSPSQLEFANFALYITLSRDMLLLKYDFFPWSEFSVDILMDIFRATEKSNPPRYRSIQQLMDFQLGPDLHESMLIIRLD